MVGFYTNGTLAECKTHTSAVVISKNVTINLSSFLSQLPANCLTACLLSVPFLRVEGLRDDSRMTSSFIPCHL